MMSWEPLLEIWAESRVVVSAWFEMSSGIGMESGEASP